MNAKDPLESIEVLTDPPMGWFDTTLATRYEQDKANTVLYKTHKGNWVLGTYETRNNRELIKKAKIVAKWERISRSQAHTWMMENGYHEEVPAQEKEEIEV